MHIVIATGLFPPEIGGPATHAETLVRLMPARGDTVTVIPFARVRKYPKVIRHVAYFFLVLLAARKADVVYALDPVSVGLPALLASKSARKPCVLRVAGDYAWEQAQGRYGVTLFPEQFVSRVRTQAFFIRLLAGVERYVAHGATRIVVPSEYMRHIVGAWGIDEKKITVVYTAFSPVVVRESRETLRARFGLTGTVIASAGRLVPWKGMRVLIEVVADLAHEYADISCVIAGDGPEYAALVAYAKERGVADRVRFLGRLSKQALAETIVCADIFVLNTGYEGFSHQLLEVMSLSVPIVTTSVGGNTELITHEKEGLLVPYDDRVALAREIIRLVRNDTLRAQVVAGARARALSYSETRMVEETRALLSSVVRT